MNHNHYEECGMCHRARCSCPKPDILGARAGVPIPPTAAAEERELIAKLRVQLTGAPHERDNATRMADRLRGCLEYEHEDDGHGFCKGCERHMGEISEHG